MNLSRTIKLIYVLIIFTCLIIVYVYFTAESSEITSNFRLLNTSDILQHLHNKHNAPNNKNTTLFGLQLKYELAPASCDPSTKLVILITSHFHNVETRSAMRRAFNTSTLSQLNIRRVFLLGTVSPGGVVSQAAVENESTRFQDILQGNFMEAYRNLTYKHLMGLKWAGDHCKQARFVIKMDDDIVIDLRKVVRHLYGSRIKNNVNSTLLAGYVLKDMIPKREPANKWFVTKEEFASDAYPTFLSGWFYVTNPNTARLLYLASKMYSYFWIDDTFITGILAKFLQIQHVNIAQYYTLHTQFIWCCIDDYLKRRVECPFFVGPNGGDANLYIEFNEAVGNCSIRACSPREKNITETCISTLRTKLGEGKAASIEKYNLF